ncbi:hypothetical protein ABEB36_009646 [Hypothenemus hampei]|uniref:MADF domain-containing protein n=1 Tax=Hypothenemus hampei TaxID=57062 RepID=A0ABD1EL28_HYPHA
MTERVNWSSEDDEILIDFIRNHEGLYNIKSAEYRNMQEKQRLWHEIGSKLRTDCSKRWAYMRDYYVRKRGKPSTGSSAEATKKRSDLLSFLDSFPTAKRSSFIFVNHLIISSRPAQSQKAVMIPLRVSKKRKRSSTSEARLQLLQEIARKPRSMQEPQDETDMYFATMAKIVKNCPGNNK